MADERSGSLPGFFIRQMLERKWLGDKTKGGFYKEGEGRWRGKTSGWRWIGRPWKIVRGRRQKFPALDMAKNLEQTSARVRMLLGLDGGGPQKE